MIKTLIVASCIALTCSSQLSMAGASQIGQTSATNLSGVVLAHIGYECEGVKGWHQKAHDGTCTSVKGSSYYKHTGCRKKHGHEYRGKYSCSGIFK